MWVRETPEQKHQPDQEISAGENKHISLNKKRVTDAAVTVIHASVTHFQSVKPPRTNLSPRNKISTRNRRHTQQPKYMERMRIHTHTRARRTQTHLRVQRTQTHVRVQRAHSHTHAHTHAHACMHAPRALVAVSCVTLNYFMCFNRLSCLNADTHTRIQSCMHAHTRPYVMCKLCLRACVQTYTAHLSATKKDSEGLFCLGRLCTGIVYGRHMGPHQREHITRMLASTLRSCGSVTPSRKRPFQGRSHVYTHTHTLTQREHASTHGEAVFVRPAL